VRKILCVIYACETMVASIIAYSLSALSAKVLKRFSQTPLGTIRHRPQGDGIDESLDSEVGEGHRAVVTDPVDPYHAVFDVHFVGDVE
jgi:hypothetical protein